MNRIAVWILGIVSGSLLLFGVLMLGMHGYGASSGCVSYGPNAAPCTPTLQQITIESPLGDGSTFTAGLTILLLAILIGLPAWIASPILALRRGASARTAILIISIISSALVIVSVVSPLFASPALATPETCLGSGGPGISQMCFFGAQAKLVALLGIGLSSLLASMLLGAPAWVMALTETARLKRWGWFVTVLCLSPIATMFYGFFGARRLPAAAASTPTPAVSARH